MSDTSDTSEPAGSSRFSPAYRCTCCGDGRPGPIEERLGRRLVRLIDAESDEGRGLLATGRVEWIGPDGHALGTLRPREAYARLLRRLDRRIAELGRGSEATALREGRGRLLGWSRRLGGGDGG